MDSLARDLIRNIRALGLVNLEAQLRFDAMLLQELAGARGGFDAETEFLERACHVHHPRLLFVRHRNEHRPRQRERAAGRLLGFEIREPKRLRHPQHFAGRAHFRAQQRIDLREHVERQHDFLHPDVRDALVMELQVAQRRPEHELRGVAGHRHVADFRYQRHGAGGTRISFQYVDQVLTDGVLDVHDANHLKFVGNTSGVFLNSDDMFLG